MKKVLRKFLSMMLVLGMILSLASVPAMADGTYTKNEKFKIGFDALTADATIGSKPNQYVNGGKEDGMYSGFYVKDEISESESSFYLYDGATYNGGASSKIITREGDNEALLVTLAETKTCSPYIDFGNGLNIAPADQNSVMHVGLDVMRFDTNCDWIFRIKTGTNEWQYDLLSFTTDSKIKFLGSEVTTYNTNNWYNLDIYFDVDTNNWYLYIGGQEAKTVKRNLTSTSLERFRSTWTGTGSAEVKIALDNFRINEYIYEEIVAPDPEPVETETYVKAGFDALTANDKIGNASGNGTTAYNGGIENTLWSGFSFENEVTTEYKGLSVSDGATYNAGASSKIISRSTDDNAMEITVSSAATVSPYLSMGDGLGLKFEKDNSVLHFGIDIYRYDTSCDWSLVLKDVNNGYQLYDLIQFNAGGKFKFLGSEVCDYANNTWYNMDIYHRVNSDRWYLYLDGELAKTAVRDINLTTLDFIRANWTSPSGVETKLAVDNICIGEILPDTKLGNILLTQGDTEISDKKFTAGTINAECEVILSDASKAPSIVIAHYVDGALEGLSTGTYANGKATASFDVKSQAGKIKVMLLDDINTIKPLKTSIELAAK